MSTLCGYCSKSPEKLLKCVCGKVKYCDSKCQKLDWMNHKKDCPPFVIRDVGQMGRGMIATRNLPRGTCVFEESPIFSSDKTVIDDEEEREMLDEFSKLSPEKQAQILDLEDPEDKKIDDDLGEKLKRIKYKNNMAIFRKERCTLYHLMVNCSMINHSCNPNLVQVNVESDENNNQLDRVITWVDVKKGDELTVNYFYHFRWEHEEGSAWINFNDRQLMIKQKYNFDCKCETCLLGSETDFVREQHRRLDEEVEFFKRMHYYYFVFAEKKLQLGKLFDNGVLFKDLMDCIHSAYIEKGQNAKLLDKFNMYKKEFKIFLNTSNFPNVVQQELIEAFEFEMK